MMMSPLNILATQSNALSNSSNSTLETSTNSSSSNRSPDNCSHQSKSPPSPTLLDKSDPNVVSSMAAANNAASILHAAIAAGNVPAMSSTLAQMFPGTFPLHIAAAAAAFYGNSGIGGTPGTHSNGPNYLYPQAQQPQQLSSLLANAATRMTPNSFQSGKKLSEMADIKLSLTQANSHVHHNHVQHSPFSSMYSAPNAAANRHNNQPLPTGHPLMPLTKMMNKQGSVSDHLSPHTDTASTSSPRSSSGHHALNSSSNASSSSSLLSPILFSPLSSTGSQPTTTSTDTINSSQFAKQRKTMLDVVGSEVASTTAESPYTANYHRIASRTPSSPPMGQSGPSGSGITNVDHHHSTSTGNNGGNGNTVTVLHCPICSISLDGIDINQHFFEEMHKIDSMRKLPDWSNESSTSSAPNNADCPSVNDNGKRCSEQTLMINNNTNNNNNSNTNNNNNAKSNTDLLTSAFDNGKFPMPPATTAGNAPSSSGINSYQKKLQLPQSRWETFQRIRQNRHTRLAAFMRLTRRKYEAAYESSIQQQQHAAHHPNMLGCPSALLGQASNSSASMGSHPSHHSHSQQQQQQSPLPPPPPHHQPMQRSPNMITSHPSVNHHHHHQPHHHPVHHSQNKHGQPHNPFEIFTKDPKTLSPNSGGVSNMTESPNRNMLHSPDNNGQLQLPTMARSSPASASSMTSSASAATPSSLSAAAAAYQTHSLFAQNPGFLHSPLSFYPYHSAAAAAAAAVAAFPSGYGSFPGVSDSFFNGCLPLVSPNSAISNSTANKLSIASQQGSTPKIWRSVDTDQLEVDDENRGNGHKFESKQKNRSNSNGSINEEHERRSADDRCSVSSMEQQRIQSHQQSPDHHSISPVSSVHSLENGQNSPISINKRDFKNGTNNGNNNGTNNTGTGNAIVDVLNLKKSGSDIESSDERAPSHSSSHHSEDELMEDEIMIDDDVDD